MDGGAIQCIRAQGRAARVWKRIAGQPSGGSGLAQQRRPVVVVGTVPCEIPHNDLSRHPETRRMGQGACMQGAGGKQRQDKSKKGTVDVSHKLGNSRTWVLLVNRDGGMRGWPRERRSFPEGVCGRDEETRANSRCAWHAGARGRAKWVKKPEHLTQYCASTEMV
jgi:hypothetical protein